MSIFKNQFSIRDKKPSSGESPMPTREIRLPFAASPENGHRFAELFVETVKKNEGIQLDYSLSTIDFVGKFLQRFRDEGLSVNDFAETIFVAGCYLGQIMINNNNGHWITQSEVNLPEGVSMMPIVVKLQNGTVADPIAKAYKRFHFGKSDDLKYFYHVFTKES